MDKGCLDPAVKTLAGWGHSYKTRGLSCKILLLSFYNVVAPHLLITYFQVYTQSRHLHINYAVVGMLFRWEGKRSAFYFFYFFAGGRNVTDLRLPSNHCYSLSSFFLFLSVRCIQSWILAKWKQISCFSNQSFECTLKWVGELITAPVVFSLLC